MDMEDLLRNGTVTEEEAGFLRVAVSAGYNCFVCGGTSSGKTTNAERAFPIHPRETGESRGDRGFCGRLQIDQVENIVRLECRNANVQGKGGVDMSQLVKASLRLRPDRIIIGEVRGKEVMDMIQAMNTGHDGSLSTGHANGIEGMLKRLEAMFLQAADFPVEAIRSQITEGIDIVDTRGARDGGREPRSVTEISELKGMENGEIAVNPLFRKGSRVEGSRLIHRERLQLAGYEAAVESMPEVAT